MFQVLIKYIHFKTPQDLCIYRTESRISLVSYKTENEWRSGVANILQYTLYENE